MFLIPIQSFQGAGPQEAHGYEILSIKLANNARTSLDGVEFL